MQEGGFGSGVGNMPVSGMLEQCRVAARVDDAGSVTRDHIVAFYEKGKESHGHEEATGNVGLECFRPVLGLRFHEVRGDGFRAVEIRLACSVKPCCIVTGDSRIIDQELDAIGF